MKELYAEGIANHSDPESCGQHREVFSEALTGALPGADTESRKHLPDADPMTLRGRPHAERRHSEALGDPAGSKTRRTARTFRHENRETPGISIGVGRMDRTVQGPTQTTVMHVPGESDEGVVPLIHRRPAGRGKGEGRPETLGNLDWSTMPETQDSDHMMSGLERIRQAARGNKEIRFTSLLHHITVGMLEDSYRSLSRNASSGIDGVTWTEYGEDLAPRLADLHGRVHEGRYRALPSKRVWIPKADGRMRPLGIAALEDKIVQLAVVWVLQAIYEEDFAGFSYGFRPGRSQHQALDAIWVGITERNVNWIVDADITSFFDTLDHEWLMKFVEHRVADPRILRLLRKWLRAGVNEDGAWSQTPVGTPQGAVISPLLANIYLHHVLDLWIKWWRSHDASGETIIVRYADDFVVGFKTKDKAERFLHDLHERLAKFSLKLHPDKTRLIEFGRFATANRAKRGERRPETFAFLGFTHHCAKQRKDGGFTIIRTTIAKRLGAAVHKIGQTLMTNRALPLADQGKWLGAVVRGWLNYHAVPGNSPAIHSFRYRIVEAWRRALRRRSQAAGRGTTWAVMQRIAARYLPKVTILHPYPNQRLRVST
ncbi:MAG: group II intron reverse transcriptase/maturase [Planctomycetes bacterium]|nr:group II intron reverse transcriptase/maturase [Planctomycetota bacterium]